MNDIAISDIAGRKAGAIDRQVHQPNNIERQIDAMMMLLLRPGGATAWKTDELRRAIEELAPDFYEGSAYYERWVSAMRDLMLEKGLVTRAEIETKMGEIRAREK